MSGPPDPADGDFERWLDDRLDTHLGVHAVAPAPKAARYREPGRRFAVTPLRLGIAAAAAVLAIGGGAAYAAGTGHGTSVSHAATSCSTGAGDSHGDCVSAAAHSPSNAPGHHGPQPNGGSASNNDTHGDTVSRLAHTCSKTPPDNHGDCVSSTASGGKAGAHSSTNTTRGQGDVHGDVASGAAPNGHH